MDRLGVKQQPRLFSASGRSRSRAKGPERKANAVPQRYTIVFPGGEIEHRYSDDLPALGSTIHALGTDWLVTEVGKGRRISVRELPDDLSGPDAGIKPVRT